MVVAETLAWSSGDVDSVPSFTTDFLHDNGQITEDEILTPLKSVTFLPFT